MTRKGLPLALICAAATLFCLAAAPAHAEGFLKEELNLYLLDEFQQGRWRVELAGVDASFSNKYERDDDYFGTASVEYSWPVHRHMTLGLRAYPLFVYSQNVPAKTLWGGGIGVAGRIYKAPESYTGWYVEGGAAMVFHDELLRDNSSHANFLLELGVGYAFESNWHTGLKFHHISNGGVGSDNAGTNGIGLAVGYTF